MRTTLFLLALLLLSCQSNSPNPPIALAGLEGKECDVVEDAEGVLHLKAATELAVYACFGFVHGRDRAFQLDFLRRAVQGRLSEILGQDHIKSDFFLRLMGLAERARTIYEALPTEVKQNLLAYAQGASLGLQSERAKSHYALRQLSYYPEPWAPEDSISLLLLQSLHETQATFWHKLKEENRRQKFGPAVTELFSRDGFPWNTVIVKEGAPQKNRRSAAIAPTGVSPTGDLLPPVTHEEGTGSNNWVLSPTRSASGRAWLANDPHLGLTHPPFWHWIHVQGGGIDAIGGTIPGIPSIPSGLNRHVSWGLTDSYFDVGDLIAISNTELHEFESHRPIIWVKVGPVRLPFFFKSFRRSKEGYPVLPIDAPAGEAIVLRWSGFLVTHTEVAPLFDFLKAKSVAEMEGIISRFGLPTWNFVSADTAGNIAYRTNGLLPDRGEDHPWGILQGHVADLTNWKMKSAAKAPHLQNPKSGVIVTANNLQGRAKTLGFSGRAHHLGFRAFRIEELLARRVTHDLKSQQRIQCDFELTDARFLLPELLKFAEGRKWNATEKMALEVLRKWDFSGPIDCLPCALYQRWLDRIYEKTPLDIGATLQALKKPDRWAGILDKSFSEAVGDLKESLRAEAPTAVQRAYFPNLLGESPLEKPSYIRVPAGKHAVSQSNVTWAADHYRQTSGPSHRLLVEMASPPRAYFRLAGPNRDTPKGDIAASGSDWVSWRDCELKRLQFPFDWASSTGDRIVF